ncbi:hypothetical protein ACUVZD_000194 [Pseudomonas aeruginosa]
MAKKTKLFWLLPVFQNQEMLLTFGLVLNETEHNEFMERPSWGRWKELLQRDLAAQLERALSQGLMRPSDLEEFAAQSLGRSSLAFMPGSQMTPAMLAELLLARDLSPESPAALIESWLYAAMNGDSAQMAQIVEAALERYPQDEMDIEKLISLSPVERLQRLEAAMS